MSAKRRKSDFLKLSDEEFQNPLWPQSVQMPKLPGLEIRLNPRLDEIVAEARRRRLKDKDGKFRRPGEDGGSET